MARTSFTFINHKLNIEKAGTVSIYDLHLEQTNNRRIIFMNSNGVLSVTGDYDNWIFDREFNPEKENYVADYYWLQRLEMNSSQRGSEFSKEKTKKAIESELTKTKNPILIEYFNDCLDNIDLPEQEYRVYAFNAMPDIADNDCRIWTTVYSEDTKEYLKIIFDGFEEIIDRIKRKDLSIPAMAELHTNYKKK